MQEDNNINNTNSPNNITNNTKNSKKFKLDYKFTSVVIIVFLVVGIIFLSFYCVYLKNFKYEDYQNILDINDNLRKQNNELRTGYKTFITAYEVEEYYKTNYVRELNNTNISDELARKYVESTNDKYGYYYTQEEWEEFNKELNGEGYGIGVLVQHKDNILTVLDVFENTQAWEEGLRPNDIILGTDTIDFSTITYDEILSLIKGEKGTSVTLRIKRDNEYFTINPIRDDYEVNTVRVKYIEEDNKLYSHIKITNFYNTTTNEFQKALNDAKEKNVDGIIFDVRDNGGGTLSSVTQMLDFLLPEGVIVYINTKNESDSYSINSTKNVLIDNIPMVVLINNKTASAAELFTSSLRDYEKVSVIGTLSYGKGCGQTMYYLSNGGVVKLTSFLYDPPFSDNYDGVGITPDITIELDEEYLETSLYLLDESCDAQLLQAIEVLSHK